MNAGYSQPDFANFERRLRERMDQLKREIDEARERGESFRRLAGEAYDSGDASVADLAMTTNNADAQRDANELRDVDEALARLAAGKFGLCVRCGEPIERERLDAYPAAKRHRRCQEAHEREYGGTQTPTL